MTQKNITPKNVHATLSKHMLVDGFDMVFDMEKSKGSYIYDSRTGRRFLDFFTFFSSSPIGHNHPRFTTPEMLEKFGRVAVNNVTNSDIYTLEMARFVDAFFEQTVPKSFKYGFFIAGGALGIENSIKAAMDWKVRKNFAKGYRHEVGHQVIHFERCFHGRTGYTVSMTNTADPNKYKYFGKFLWPRILSPAVRFPLTEGHLEEVGRLEKLALNQIKTAFRENPDDICAILIEPVQCEGGDRHFRTEFLRELKVLADENDAMLLFDEVQTGFGMTGKWWCFEHFGFEPDMFCFGKKSQVCGFVAGPKIDEVEENVFHISSRINSTWGGNIVDMFRAYHYIQIIVEEKLLASATTMGKTLLSELQKLQKEFPEVVLNARGRGLLCAFDMPDGQLRDQLRHVLYENGLALLGCGDRTIRFRPPLNLAENELEEGIKILRKGLQKLTRHPEVCPTCGRERAEQDVDRFSVS
ncbi:MAG: L-lysine 6-transaminase [Calditrichaeota bacterium]|nr:L-lysine 6-transaminase [Calditrichota bacterium]